MSLEVKKQFKKGKYYKILISMLMITHIKIDTDKMLAFKK